MKRLLTILGKISAIVVLALAGIFVLIGGPCSVAHRIQFDRFVSSVDAEYFMDEAIALIKQHNNYIGYNRRGDEYNSPFSDLPPFFANMNARWMSVESNYLRIEFHGGFDHYGFHVREMDGEWIQALGVTSKHITFGLHFRRNARKEKPSKVWLGRHGD